MGGNNDLKRSRVQIADSNISSKDGERTVEPPTKKARVEENKSLFIRSLPPSVTADRLTEFFSEHFPVKHATVILDPQTKLSRGYGFVTFTDADDAKEAKEKFRKQKIDGRPLVLEIAEARHRQTASDSTGVASKKAEREAMLAEARKAPKLIVRNLPWSIKSSNQLAALFQSHGKVKFADLPNAKGKLSGFGFVTMRGRKNAEKAMDAINGKTVDGRTLAVDWAVDKQTWEQQKHQPQDDATKDTEAVDSTDASKDKPKPSGKRQAEDESEDEKEEKEDDDEEEDEDIKNFMKNHMENLEDEDSEAEKDKDEDEKDAKAPAITSTPKPMTTNTTTLFIRNLPFTTTDTELKAHFEQFGRIRYARIVVDRATDRPAGTGFVCFVSEDDSKTCLKGAPRPQQSAIPNKKSILQNELADEAGKYTIDGRILQVSQAVNKDEASRLAETGAAAREGKEKDKRRLYLLAEGTIPNGSPLYDLLAPSEVKIREQSAIQRKKLIQSNPSLHLSLTRLAIRNIPRDIDSKKLKALAREAVVGFATDVKQGRRQPLSKEETTRGGAEDRESEHRRKEKGKGIVSQAKIVFENKEGSKVPEADGAGKSRGYGFIEYSSHRWALMGLRYLNGHALTYAGKTYRLIVEFAIENAQVVARRKDMQTRQQQMRNTQPSGDRDAVHSTGQAGSRGPGAMPRGKDFSVSKGKWQKQEKGKVADKPTSNSSAPAESKDDSARDTLQQKIIARKRMTRKKKAQGRH